MKMLVLAGGFGTRLQTAVPGVPKALAPIGAVPFLQLQIEHWISQGLRSFTFLLHHQAELIIEFLRAQQVCGLKECQINWLVEPTPMDTGGAVAYAVKQLELTEDFLLVNADTWLGSGIRELAQSVAPAMAVVSMADVSRYGQVHFGTDAKVTSFTEKNASPRAGWINAGLCRISPALFNDWDGLPFSLERELFAELVQSRRMSAVPLQTDFIDIGIPDDYYRFARWIEAGQPTPLCN